MEKVKSFCTTTMSEKRILVSKGGLIIYGKRYIMV